MAVAGMDTTPRAAIRAQTQIRLSIIIFNNNKSYMIQPEQWIQRITFAIQAGAWTNEQTMCLQSTTLQKKCTQMIQCLRSKRYQPKLPERSQESFVGVLQYQNQCHKLFKRHYKTHTVLDYFSKVGEKNVGEINSERGGRGGRAV
jgi:hypothetical protein